MDGLIFALLPVLGVATGLMLRWRSWRRAWFAEPLIDFAHRIRWRTTKHAGALEQVRAATRACLRVLAEHSNPRFDELAPFWVEIVRTGEVFSPTAPDGKTEEGRLVLASVRTVRLWPWSRATHVIVVRSATDTGALIVHEFFQHVLPQKLGRGTNAGHTDVVLRGLDRTASRAYAKELGR